MQQLLGDRPGLNASFLQEHFLQWLPSNVRIVLASTPDATSLDQLAKMADKVMEVAAPSVASVTKPTAPSAGLPSNLAAEVNSLRAEVSRLEKLVQKLNCQYSTSRHSSRRSPTPIPTTPATDTLCWFHRKFADQARNCRPPCSWPSNEQASH